MEARIEDVETILEDITKGDFPVKPGKFRPSNNTQLQAHHAEIIAGKTKKLFVKAYNNRAINPDDIDTVKRILPLALKP